MSKKKALVIDLDGTLCNIEHRLHLIDMAPGREDRPIKDWDTFFERMDQDKMHHWCAEIIRRFYPDYEIVFCTGRSEPYRAKTELWIKTNLPEIEHYHLFMRPGDDHRSDNLVKEDLYMAYIEPQFETLFVLDDRLRLAKMWRKLGLVCLHCHDGEF